MSVELKVLNPLTNRTITVGSSKYYQLIRNGTILPVSNYQPDMRTYPSNTQSLNTKTIGPGILDLPLEILEQVLMNLTIEDIRSMCQTNTNIASICNSKLFWIGKLNHDFTLKSDTKDMLPSDYFKLSGIIYEGNEIMIIFKDM